MLPTRKKFEICNGKKAGQPASPTGTCASVANTNRWNYDTPSLSRRDVVVAEFSDIAGVRLTPIEAA